MSNGIIRASYVIFKAKCYLFANIKMSYFGMTIVYYSSFNVNKINEPKASLTNFK